MRVHPNELKNERITNGRMNLRRRIVAATLLGTLMIAVPFVAAAAPVPHRNVRVPMLDGRVIEYLQRWVGEEEDCWREEA